VAMNLPAGQLSNVPWRRAGVRYANNEAYFDCIEEIDAIIDKSGGLVTCEVQGYIDCLVKLSGMPDLTMNFVNPRLLDDVSFHPCVRYKRWESEKVLSFVPPDGQFRLVSYHISAQNNIQVPIYARHNIVYREGSSGRFELTLGHKNTAGKTVEKVSVETTFPKSVLSVSMTPSQGRYTFDPTTKIMTWDVGEMEPGKSPNLKGSIALISGGEIPEMTPSLNLKFQLSGYTASGVRVHRVDCYGEKYKPFKGVKYNTRAGRFQIRT